MSANLRRSPWLKSVLSLLLVAVVGLVAADLALSSTPFDPSGPAFPPHAKPYGKSLGNWNAEWWNWMAQFPYADNPITDTDGSRGGAAYQPDGPVWFLAGNFGGVGTRTVEIPPGKGLLFPLINSALWSPEDCVYIGAPTPCTADDLASALEIQYGTAPLMTATLDGHDIRALSEYRATSDAFTFEILPDSLGTDFGYTPGPRYPSVADGYYVMLKPLPPGEHILHFTVTGADGTLFLDMTYYLNVRH
jgi:hypothetical protein